jgi:hypothetical protein
MIRLLFLAALLLAQEPQIERPIRVKVHKDAAKWEPFALKIAGDPNGPGSSKSRVRKYPLKDGDVLYVVNVYPPGIRWKARHHEVRFKIIEGWLEEVEVAAILSEIKEDSVTLRKNGVEFQQESPGSAEVRIAAFETGSGGHHAGSVRKSELGDFSWSADLPGRKPQPKFEEPKPEPEPAPVPVDAVSTGTVVAPPAQSVPETQAPAQSQPTGGTPINQP